MHKEASPQPQATESNQRAGTRAEQSRLERRCLVTGISGQRDNPAAPLIRFVLSPDNVVTPDLAETLPGRGFYVTADPALIQQAIDKKLFARAARPGRSKQAYATASNAGQSPAPHKSQTSKQCHVPDGLIDIIHNLLEARVETLLGLGKKGAYLVLGEDNVSSGLKNRSLGLLLLAGDASPRTAADMTGKAANSGISAYLSLPAARLGAAIGRDNAVYIGINKGKFAQSVQRDCARLAAFVTRHPKESEENGR